MNPPSPNPVSITLYGVALSGHCHRVELLLRMLKLPYVRIDAPAPVRQTAEFASLNPLRQIPVLQDGEHTLADSNAIMVYLVKRYAPGSHWLPEDAIGAATVQRWLSIAAGEIAYGPAKARVSARWGDVGLSQAFMSKLADKVLAFMETELTQRTWLAAAHVTLADLACYSYIAHAPEGGIDLTPYPSVRAWIQRVEQLPEFVQMPA